MAVKPDVPPRQEAMRLELTFDRRVLADSFIKQDDRFVVTHLEETRARGLDHYGLIAFIPHGDLSCRKHGYEGRVVRQNTQIAGFRGDAE